MNILYIRPYAGEAELITVALPTCTIVASVCVFDLTPEERAGIEILSVFVNYQVTEDVLQALPNLKFITTRSAGYDHLDMPAIRSRGIVVSRVPHYGTRTVAEYVFALLFAFSRNAYQAYLDMQRNVAITSPDSYEGFDICGKTLGVIGTGAIGHSVCQIALGLGMKVKAFDTIPNEALVAQGVQYYPVETVLTDADIVTIHIPSLPETKHFLNSDRLALMKRGAYLINTARGEVVDTIALVDMLRAGKLAGAALDVLENEHDLRDELTLLSHTTVSGEIWKTLVANHALLAMPNVIVTPHIAFNTKEAKREITDVTIKNIESFITGEPQNIVVYG